MVFFLVLFPCNFDDQLSPNVHRFFILCICWDIRQVRVLVFDHYQLCTVPLKIGSAHTWQGLLNASFLWFYGECLYLFILFCIKTMETSKVTSTVTHSFEDIRVEKWLRNRKTPIRNIHQVGTENPTHIEVSSLRLDSNRRVQHALPRRAALKNLRFKKNTLNKIEAASLILTRGFINHTWAREGRPWSSIQHQDNHAFP